MSFSNLQKLALATGYPGITLEFLMQAQGQLSRFVTVAMQHELPADVGEQAKVEFIRLMEMGKTMMAVTEREEA